MLKNLIASALFAGLAVGVIAFALQQWLIVPVIQEAELYETGAKTHFAGVVRSDHADEDGSAGGHSHGAGAGHGHRHGDETAVGDGEMSGGAAIQRHAQTFFADLVAYTGLALLLVAAYAFAETRGVTVTPRQGLIWGICAFLALHVATSAGLPPELPGMTAADVTVRQVWQVATALATALGIAAIAFGHGPGAWVIGIALILAPQLVGAPQPDQLFGTVPPEMAAEFAGRSLAVNAAVWALLGVLTAWFRERQATG